MTRARDLANSADNVWTDADNTKLDGIEAAADVTDATNVTAAGAAMLSGANFTGTATAPSFQANAGGTFTTASGNDLNIVYPDSRSLFIKEGSTTHLTVDNVGNVGVSNTAPDFNLSVGNSSSVNPSIQIMSATNSNAQLLFGDGAGAAGYRGTVVYGNATDSMSFSTAGGERMRLDSSGNLLVGKTSTGFGTAGGEIKSNGQITATASSAAAGQFNRLTNDGTLLNFAQSGSTVGSIFAYNGYLGIGGTGGNDAHMIMGYDVIAPASSTGAAKDNAIDIGDPGRRFKDLYLSGGAYLGGTGSANKLEDYEEGTYTPAFTSTGASFSYSVQLGSYVKIGQLVCCWFNLTLTGSAPSGTTTNTLFFNVPFATNNVDNSLYSGGHIGHYFNINLGSGTTIAYQVPAASATQIELKEVSDNLGENGIVASELNASAVIRGSVMYRAAS